MNNAHFVKARYDPRSDSFQLASPQAAARDWFGRMNAEGSNTEPTVRSDEM
jgi:hypothetical protein